LPKLIFHLPAGLWRNRYVAWRKTVARARSVVNTAGERSGSGEKVHIVINLLELRVERRN
jgi:hypothetical protein